MSKPRNIPLLDEKSKPLCWQEALEGLSCAHELHLLPELGPLPCAIRLIIMSSNIPIQGINYRSKFCAWAYLNICWNIFSVVNLAKVRQVVGNLGCIWWWKILFPKHSFSISSWPSLQIFLKGNGVYRCSCPWFDDFYIVVVEGSWNCSLL